MTANTGPSSSITARCPSRRSAPATLTRCCHWEFTRCDQRSTRHIAELAARHRASVASTACDHRRGCGGGDQTRSIVDTGDIDKATYDKLAAVAPTLTRSNGITQPWTWQTQLSWTAKALGRDNTAKTLLDEASAQQNKIRSEHPAFAGKTITVVNYTDSATTVAARESPATSYLEGIGFTYNTKFTRDVNDPLDTAVNLTSDSNYQVTSTDVVIVARTDKGRKRRLRRAAGHFQDLLGDPRHRRRRRHHHRAANRWAGRHQIPQRHPGEHARRPNSLTSAANAKAAPGSTGCSWCTAAAPGLNRLADGY